jgi:hypothetical protein
MAAGHRDDRMSLGCSRRGFMRHPALNGWINVLGDDRLHRVLRPRVQIRWARNRGPEGAIVEFLESHDEIAATVIRQRNDLLGHERPVIVVG